MCVLPAVDCDIDAELQSCHLGLAWPRTGTNCYLAHEVKVVALTSDGGFDFCYESSGACGPELGTPPKRWVVLYTVEGCCNVQT